MSDETKAASVAEVLRLVEVDHRATTEFVARMITLDLATRGVVFTASVGLAGLAASSKTWVLVIAAAPLLLVGLIVEVRSGFLIDRAHRRSIALERIVQSHVSVHVEAGRAQADRAVRSRQRHLDSYVFGVSHVLEPVIWRQAIDRALSQVYPWLYGALAVMLIAVATVVGLAPQPQAQTGSSQSRV